jgi:glycosyltransferase involved in cell wall biosynthesis
MHRGKSIGVVVPSFNVEHLLPKVIDTMPGFVDWIVVVDDTSNDRTNEVARGHAAKDKRVVVLRHEANRGVGAAIGTGYKWCRDHGVDVTAVMAGDYQMDPAELDRVVDPVCLGVADYSKGNRLFAGDAWKKIPRVRFLGNSALSLMTKIASGYWHSADSQTGYTAISLEALRTIDLDSIYPRYGCPNDILVKLNIYDFRVIDVPVRPVYGVGEKSGIKIPKVIFSIGWLLVRLFFWRLREKYVYRDFHPLVFFYLAAFTLIPLGLLNGFAILLFNTPILGQPLPVGWIILCALLMISGLQALFFAMWFDMDYNRANCIFFRRTGLGVGPRELPNASAPLHVTPPPAPTEAPDKGVEARA